MVWVIESPIPRSYSGKTAIVLRTRWHPAKFLTDWIYKPSVTIDSATSILPWGEHFFEVAPGTHEVEVTMGGTQGLARIQVEVDQGQIVHLKYRGPVNVLMEGKIKLVT